jgi:2-polyprenyl-3-methyl-5-hydroxy-6-metoxy-1,4-benzoquinol methylase
VSGDNTLLAEGSYARKQIFCKDRIVAWSHSSRYARARALVAAHRGRPLLDYGAGDGTFLFLIRDLFPDAVGVDSDPKQVAECARRFVDVPGLSFALADSVRGVDHTGRYGVVVCMEVLEHCLDPTVDDVLDDLVRLVAVDGMVLISVPIEIGPSLLLKHVVRMIAGWRRLGDYRYREKHTPLELAKLLCAGRNTRITRPVYHGDDFAPGRPNVFHGHKGFNWRRLRTRLEGRLTVSATGFSPLGQLGGYVSSQVWFTCRPRP